jgi:hypothetical protein
MKFSDTTFWQLSHLKLLSVGGPTNQTTTMSKAKIVTCLLLHKITKTNKQTYRQTNKQTNKQTEIAWLIK